MKHVIYGKVSGVADLDRKGSLNEIPSLTTSYRWLGQFCGFCPQVWLARGRSQITGKEKEGQILFGFENIVGFGVDYEHWETLITTVFQIQGKWMHDQRTRLGVPDTVLRKLTDIPLSNEELTSLIEKDMTETNRSIREDPEDQDFDIFAGATSFEEFLKKRLFVLNDQVVVPSLNLKAAKLILCHSERDKRKLRCMGFIEDRVRIGRKWKNLWGF